VRLLPEARLREATSVSMSGTDEVFGMERWGLGYAIGAPGVPEQEAPTPGLSQSWRQV
jgi:hypothetical protein